MANDPVFTAAVAVNPPHNSLPNIQGGTTDQRLHISQAEYASLLKAIKHVEGTAPYAMAATSTWTIALPASAWFPLGLTSAYVNMSTAPRTFTISKYDALSIRSLVYRVYNGNGAMVSKIDMVIGAASVPTSQLTYVCVAGNVRTTINVSAGASFPSTYDYIEVTYTPKDVNGAATALTLKGSSSTVGSEIYPVKLLLTTTDNLTYTQIVTSFVFTLPIGTCATLSYKWNPSVSAAFEMSGYFLVSGARFAKYTVNGTDGYYLWTKSGYEYSLYAQVGAASLPSVLTFVPATGLWFNNGTAVSNVQHVYGSYDASGNYTSSYPQKNYYRQADVVTNSLTLTDYITPVTLWQICPRISYGGTRWRLDASERLDVTGNFVATYRDEALVNTPTGTYNVIQYNNISNKWFSGTKLTGMVSNVTELTSNLPSIPSDYTGQYGTVYPYFINYYKRNFIFAIPKEVPYRKFKLLNPKGIDVSQQLRRPEGTNGVQAFISAGGTNPSTDQVTYDYFLLADVATCAMFGTWTIQFI